MKNALQTYLVGGAVRDQLLGRPVKEKDWVVVGSTPEAMLAQGFTPVGKDFPVFLHPQTKEEYALARTERKTTKGYKGFALYASPDVTLEEDLKRRDLTINAIAQTQDGKLIDPFKGRQDLEQKLLRHVSPAFVEDPVRILRVARFAARLPDFSVHPETYQLMQQMVENGEVDALVAERVWKELEQALTEQAPERFFETLKACGALIKLFPELNDCGDCLAALKKVKKHHEPLSRFAGLLLPLSANVVKQLCQRYRVPNHYQQLAILTASYYNDFHHAKNANAEGLLMLIEKCDAFRRPERFQQFLNVCSAYDNDTGKQTYLIMALQSANSVSTEKLLQQGLKGKAFADALRLERIVAIQQTIDNMSAR